jgi:hypothetical protein
MAKSPTWEVNSDYADKKSPSVPDPKRDDGVHNNPPMDNIITQLNPACRAVLSSWT